VRSYLIDTTIQDLVHGSRILWRRPSLLIGAVLLLGLSTGAAVAFTGLADRILLRPLPVSSPERLVQVIRPARTGGLPQESLPGALCDRLHEAGASLADLLVIGYPDDEFVNVSTTGFQPETTKTAFLAANAFTVLGVRARLGRVFGVRDSDPGSDPVAIISYDYWLRRFATSPDVLGRSIRIRNQAFSVVGVLSPDFTELDLGSAPDIWVPLRQHDGGRVLAALKPGVTARQLQSALQPALDNFLGSQPSASANKGNARYLASGFEIVSARTGLSASGVSKRFAMPLAALSISGVVLLMIGCGNVGLLLLSLQEARRDEMAVRMSLGASRARLARQILTETLLLAGMGCALGLLLARWAAESIVRLASDPNRPNRIAWGFDWRVACLVCIVCVLVTLTSGLPAAMQSRSTAAPIGSRTRLRDAFIAAQMALSLVLLMAAGLLQSTWRNLNGLNPGFEKDMVVVAELQWQEKGNDRTYTDPVYRHLLEQTEALPGVRSASLSGWSYFGDNTRRAAIVLEANKGEGHENPLCEFLSVGPRFFRTMGTELIRGHDFTEADTERSRLVGVISESVSRLYFGSQNPLGKRFSIFDPQQEIEIVGVVRDAKLNSLREQAPPIIYLPFLQSQYRGTAATPASLEVRLSRSGLVSAAQLRQVIRAASPALDAPRIRTQRELVNRSLVQEHMLAVISVGFGGLGLLLATVGLAGTVSHSITRWTKECGIRMALGSQKSELVRMIMRQSLMPVIVGVAIGIPTSLAAMRLLSSVLFGIEPGSPVAVTAAVLALSTAAVISAVVPVIRASRIEPAITIRYE
jgi:predicted permease